MCPSEAIALCVLFKILYSARLDLLLEGGIGSQEGILEFDQMLPAKLGVHYLKQFILKTLYLGSRKAKHLEAESSAFQEISVSQKFNQEEF